MSQQHILTKIMRLIGKINEEQLLVGVEKGAQKRMKALRQKLAQARRDAMWDSVKGAQRNDKILLRKKPAAYADDVIRVDDIHPRKKTLKVVYKAARNNNHYWVEADAQQLVAFDALLLPRNDLRASMIVAEHREKQNAQ